MRIVFLARNTGNVVKNDRFGRLHLGFILSFCENHVKNARSGRLHSLFMPNVSLKSRAWKASFSVFAKALWKTFVLEWILTLCESPAENSRFGVDSKSRGKRSFLEV